MQRLKKIIFKTAEAKNTALEDTVMRVNADLNNLIRTMKETEVSLIRENEEQKQNLQRATDDKNRLDAEYFTYKARIDELKETKTTSPEEQVNLSRALALKREEQIKISDKCLSAQENVFAASYKIAENKKSIDAVSYHVANIKTTLEAIQDIILKTQSVKNKKGTVVEQEESIEKAIEALHKVRTVLRNFGDNHSLIELSAMLQEQIPENTRRPILKKLEELCAEQPSAKIGETPSAAPVSHHAAAASAASHGAGAEVAQSRARASAVSRGPGSAGAGNDDENDSNRYRR
jgi:chromosome segregation ATPase